MDCARHLVSYIGIEYRHILQTTTSSFITKSIKAKLIDLIDTLTSDDIEIAIGDIIYEIASRLCEKSRDNADLRSNRELDTVAPLFSFMQAMHMPIEIYMRSDLGTLVVHIQYDMVKSFEIVLIDEKARLQSIKYGDLRKKLDGKIPYQYLFVNDDRKSLMSDNDLVWHNKSKQSVQCSLARFMPELKDGDSDMHMKIFERLGKSAIVLIQFILSSSGNVFFSTFRGLTEIEVSEKFCSLLPGWLLDHYEPSSIRNLTDQIKKSKLRENDGCIQINISHLIKSSQTSTLQIMRDYRTAPHEPKVMLTDYKEVISKLFSIENKDVQKPEPPQAIILRYHSSSNHTCPDTLAKGDIAMDYSHMFTSIYNHIYTLTANRRILSHTVKCDKYPCAFKINNDESTKKLDCMDELVFERERDPKINND